MRPIFIIGAGRSGTKFLRDTLAASPEVSRIPYDVGYIWRYGNEGLEHDEIDADSVGPRQLDWMRKQLPRLVDKNVKKPDARFIVEKSVPNSLRPQLLYKAFPDALFVHIVRDGRAVAESAIRLWQAPTDKGYLLDKIRYFPWANFKYALWFVRNRLFPRRKKTIAIWGPRYAGIQEDVSELPLHEVCARQWMKCVQVTERQLSTVPSDQVFILRYEELMGDPQTVKALCDWVGVSPEPVIAAYENNIEPGNNEKWKDRLSGSQLEDINRIFSEEPELARKYCSG